MNLSKDLKDIAKNITVLYIEDNIIVQEKTEAILKNFFEKVICANDGVEAFDAYQDYYNSNDVYFDIVITDIQMPKANGITLSRNIKSINDNQIILVTSAYDESEYLIELLNLGVNNFIHKPLESEIFLNTLYNFCQKINKESIDVIVKINNTHIWNKNKSILSSNGEIIHLNANERKLLKIMIENYQQVFSLDFISELIAYETADYIKSDESVKALVKRLRKKLPLDTIKIFTVKDIKLIFELSLTLF